MRYFVIIILTCFCSVHCGYAEPEKLSWDAVTILKTNATVVVLNTQANNTTNNEVERSRAIFALFANYIKPGQTAVEIHRVLIDTAWLEHVSLHGVYILAGWIQMEMNGEDTVFCLGLFPHKKWSDRPSASATPNGLLADTEPQSDWAIYFGLSGSSQLRKEDALAFLQGAHVDGNPKIVEFALCYPHPTSPGRLPGRIERFSKYGIHAYDPWQDNHSTPTGTNTVSPLRR